MMVAAKMPKLIPNETMRDNARAKNRGKPLNMTKSKTWPKIIILNVFQSSCIRAIMSY